MTRSSALRRGLLVLGVAYFALWACAPAVFGPPPAPMSDGRSHELGLGASEGVAIGENLSTGALEADVFCDSGPLTSGCGGPAFQAWYRYDRGHADVRVTAFGGLSTLVGVGGSFAYRVLDTDRVFVAPQLSGGFLYGSVGVPVGIALVPSAWVVITPYATVSASAPFRLSEAIWVEAPGRVDVGFELQQGWTPDNTGILTAAAQVGFRF
ncbi:MAG: hypothetical protein H6735_12365 [Alphaproteobacteria bacterium]|nr:hypothetical protein [Alphaproteobacteria bacterium]